MTRTRGLLALWALSRVAALGPLLAAAREGAGAALSSWDAAWLLGIAAQGYRQPYEWAFFPAFPMLVRGLAAAGASPVLGAVAVNLALSLVGAFLLEAYALRSSTPEEARLGVAAVLFHPLSFYLAVPYTESLFFAASLAALLFAARGRWVPSAAAGAVAALARNTGMLLALPVAALALGRTSEDAPRRPAFPRLLAAAAPVLGLLGLMAVTAARAGDPWLFVHAQEHWRDHIRLAVPFAALAHDLGRWRAWVDHHLPLTLLGIALTVRVAARRRREEILLVGPPLLLSLSLSKLAISPRLHLVLFPLWLEAGRLLARRPPRERVAILSASALLGAWLAASFARGLWVD